MTRSDDQIFTETWAESASVSQHSTRQPKRRPPSTIERIPRRDAARGDRGDTPEPQSDDGPPHIYGGENREILRPITFVPGILGSEIRMRGSASRVLWPPYDVNGLGTHELFHNIKAIARVAHGDKEAIGPFPGAYTNLLHYLKSLRGERNFHPFWYDWTQSGSFLRQLTDGIGEDPGDDRPMRRDGRGDAPRRGNDLTEKNAFVWVKVGTLERHANIPPVHASSASGGSPLYCDVPADWDDEDEPKGAELPYVGDMKDQSLLAPDDSVRARYDIDQGWKTDLDADLPDGYWDEVPVGYATHFYHWFLCQPGLIDAGWFEKGMVEAQKTLKEKQKEIKDKVKDLAKGALAGTVAAPAAPLAGELAGELAKYVTDYLVEMLTAKRFDPVTLVHLTVRDDEASQPKSVVMLVANGKPVQLFRNEGTDIHPNFTQRYRKPGIDTISRSWIGASQPAGPSPRIKHDVAQQGKVVVWRKSVQGFGALVPQRQGDARYVALVRADVRLRDPNDLPEPV